MLQYCDECYKCVTDIAMVPELLKGFYEYYNSVRRDAKVSEEVGLLYSRVVMHQWSWNNVKTVTIVSMDATVVLWVLQ